MDKTRTIKQLTTSNFDFPNLIQDPERKYVDKTDLLYELARHKTDSQLFISRPRRFGKSLMLSTLKAMFEGRRELFKGLKLDSLPWECWEEKNRCPVYSFTMGDVSGATFAEVKEQLADLVDRLFRQAGIPAPEKGTVPGKFGEFIRAAAEKSPTGKVVILIDEYDEPVAAFLDDIKTLNRVRKLLHDFYEKLKFNSGVIRFLLMTGVTKLTKLSIFSGLNHLKDRTMDPRFATLLGYTSAELDGTLRENVEAFAAKRGTDSEKAKRDLLSWYDGYRFSPESEERVCNPVSLGCALESGELLNYWESTGQTTMIVKRLKNCGEIPADVNGMAATRMQLDVCQAETMPLAALMYQGGYLTITKVIDNETFRLGIPNNEVAKSLAEGYVSTLLSASLPDWTEQLADARDSMKEKGVEALLNRNLKAVFAAVPHEWKIEDEKEAKRYFLLFMKLVGADISGERQSARGRADAILKDASGVYVFEFKYGKTAREAVEQARAKEYAGPWLDGAPPVFYVGVNYDPAKRAIDDPLVERA